MEKQQSHSALLALSGMCVCQFPTETELNCPSSEFSSDRQTGSAQTAKSLGAEKSPACTPVFLLITGGEQQGCFLYLHEQDNLLGIESWKDYETDW